jgi:biopolymer transport protein ExbD
MKFPRNAKLFRGHLDVAPLAGTFFLLAMFLLMHTHMVYLPGANIRLPRYNDQALPGLTGPFVVLAMDQQGILYLDNQVVEQAELVARLRKQVEKRPTGTLVIQADEKVTLERFFKASQAATEAGIEKVLIASRPRGKAEAH